MASEETSVSSRGVQISFEPHIDSGSSSSLGAAAAGARSPGIRHLDARLSPLAENPHSRNRPDHRHKLPKRGLGVLQRWVSSGRPIDLVFGQYSKVVLSQLTMPFEEDKLDDLMDHIRRRADSMGGPPIQEAKFLAEVAAGMGTVHQGVCDPAQIKLLEERLDAMRCLVRQARRDIERSALSPLDRQLFDEVLSDEDYATRCLGRVKGDGTVDSKVFKLSLRPKGTVFQQLSQRPEIHGRALDDLVGKVNRQADLLLLDDQVENSGQPLERAKFLSVFIAELGELMQRSADPAQIGQLKVHIESMQLTIDRARTIARSELSPRNQRLFDEVLADQDFACQCVERLAAADGSPLIVRTRAGAIQRLSMQSSIDEDTLVELVDEQNRQADLLEVPIERATFLSGFSAGMAALGQRLVDPGQISIVVGWIEAMHGEIDDALAEVKGGGALLPSRVQARFDAILAEQNHASRYAIRSMHHASVLDADVYSVFQDALFRIMRGGMADVADVPRDAGHQVKDLFTQMAKIRIRDAAGAPQAMPRGIFDIVIGTLGALSDEQKADALVGTYVFLGDRVDARPEDLAYFVSRSNEEIEKLPLNLDEEVQERIANLMFENGVPFEEKAIPKPIPLEPWYDDRNQPIKTRARSAYQRS